MLLLEEHQKVMCRWVLSIWVLYFDSRNYQNNIFDLECMSLYTLLSLYECIYDNANKYILIYVIAYIQYTHYCIILIVRYIGIGI